MFKNIVVAITANTTGLRSGMTRAAADVHGVDKSMQAANATSAKLRTAILGVVAVMGVALVGALAASVNAAANFESSMNRVGALAQANGTEFDALSDKAMHLGSTTAFSASEAADGMGYLAMAGFEVNEILDAMPSTLDLATVGQIELATAADIASNVLQGFAIEASDTSRVNDVLAETAVNANTSVEQLGDAMSYAAPIAHAAGYEIEGTAAAIAMLSDAGIQGGRAGTTMVGIIAALEDVAGPAGQKLEQMGIQTHDANGELLDLADVVQQLEERGLTAGEALDVFGRRAGPGMAVLVSTGSEALRNMETRLDGAAGAAERVATQQFQGLEAALITLKSATEGALISVGRYLLPALTTGVEAIAGGVQSFAQVVSGASEEAGRLRPLVENIVSIVGSATTIFGQLYSAVQPVVTLFAQISFAVLISGLTLLSDILATTIGFVDDNGVAFAALASVLTALLLPALGRAVTHMQIMATLYLAEIIKGIAGAATGAARALAGMTAAAGGFALLAGAIAIVVTSYRNAREEAQGFAQDLRDSVGQNIDTSTTRGQIEQTRQRVEALREEWQKYEDRLNEMGNNKIDGEFVSISDARQNRRALEEELEELEGAFKQAESTALHAQIEINSAFGTDFDLDAIYELADALGIDLSTMARDEAVGALKEYAAAVADGKVPTSELADEVMELVDAHQQAVSALQSYVEEMRAATDPIFAAQRALQAEADALHELNELQASGEASRRELAEAERAVAEAHVDSAVALGDLYDETGNLIATEADLRRFFSSPGIPDEVKQRVLNDFDLVTGRAEQFADEAGIDIELDVDETRVVTGLGRVDSILNGTWRGVTHTAELDADPAPAESSINGARTVGDAWAESTFTSTADTDEAPAVERFSMLNRVLGDGWDTRTDTSTADTDIAPTESSFTAAFGIGTEWDRRTDQSTADTDGRPAEIRFRALDYLGGQYGRRHDTATADLDSGPADRTLGGLLTRLTSFANRTFKPTVSLIANWVTGAGDGPGAPPRPSSTAGNGAAARTVQQAMQGIPGLRVTSSYRTPARNRAVGGSPTSYHMDRTNPAIDVGGPTSSLDALHARLRRTSYRELIWRAPGHWDHVHYAAQGGIFRPGATSGRREGREEHVAQVAQPGDWRVWAEPETGGEAYIPLAAGKRERSSAILGDVAKQFGYQLVEMNRGGVLGSQPANAGGRVRGGDGAAAPLIGQLVVNPGAGREELTEARHQSRLLAREVGR